MSIIFMYVRVLLLLFSVLTFTGCITHSLIIRNKLTRGSTLTIQNSVSRETPLLTNTGILKPVELSTILGKSYLNQSPESYLFVESISQGLRMNYFIKVANIKDSLQDIQVEVRYEDDTTLTRFNIAWNDNHFDDDSLIYKQGNDYTYSFSIRSQAILTEKLSVKVSLNRVQNFTMGDSYHILSGEMVNTTTNITLRYLIVDDPTDKYKLLRVCSGITIITDSVKKLYRGICAKEAKFECKGRKPVYDLDYDNWFLVKPLYCKYHCE